MKKIKLSQGKFMILDNDDYKLLNKYKWSFNGRFDDKKEAALAYDRVAKKCYGNFANLNFKEVI